MVFLDEQTTLDELDELETQNYSAEDEIQKLKSISFEDMKDGLDNYGMFQLSNISEDYPVSYSNIYKTTIHNTGTALDDRNIDDVADAKETTPKDIYDICDVISSIYEGLRSGLANTFELGGELLSAVADPWYNVYENVTGEEATPPLTDEEKPHPFGSTEAKESSSYAGDIAQFLTSLAYGWKATTIKGAGAAAGAIKTGLGAKMLKALGDTLHLIASDTVSMSASKQNAAETVKVITGYSPAELLEKKEDDPLLVKRVKNALADGPAYAVLGASFKLAGIVAKPVGKGVAKVSKPVLRPVGKAIDKALQPLAKKLETPSKKAVRKIKEKIKNSTTETDEQSISSFAEQVEKHKKMFSREEIDSIVEQAIDEGTLSADVVKGANETVLRDVAASIVKLEETGDSASKVAGYLSERLASGEISKKEFDKAVIENFAKTVEAASKEKTAASGTGQIMELASESESVKATNRLLEYISKNSDRIPTTKLNEYMQALNNPKGLMSLVDMAESVVKNGRIGDFVDNFTYLMQNVMLMSISGRVQDAVGSLANLGLQVLDAGTTGVGSSVINAGKKALRKIAGKKALGTITSEADRVYATEALDMIHGMYSLFKETAIYNAKRVASKLKGGVYATQSPWQKARAQAINSSQSRLGKRYAQRKLMKGDSAFAEVINYAYNHMGVWASETIDDFIGTIAYRAHLERNVGHMARVEGISNGWTRKQIANHTRDSLKQALDMHIDPQKFIDASKAITQEGRVANAIKRSAAQAAETTFRADLESTLAKGAYQFLNWDGWNKYTRMLYPFQKVGLKIALDEYLMKRSPITLLGIPFKNSYIRRAWAAGGVARQEAVGKLANGLIIQGAIWKLMEEGKLTGPVPRDKNKYGVLKAAGWLPNAYKRDDGTYVSLKNVTGPLEPMINAITGVISYIDEINEKIDSRAGVEFSDFLLTIPAMFAENAFASTAIGDLIEAIDKGDTVGINKLTENIMRMSPPIINEIKDMFKNFKGEPEEFKQTTLSLLEQYSQRWGIGDTYTELDIFGEPMWAIKRSAATLGARVSTMPTVDTIDEMLRVKAYVSAPSQNITRDGASVKLTREQVYEWLSIMGELQTYDRIDMLVHSPRYLRSPEAEDNGMGLKSKRDQIVSVYNEQKEKALDLLIKRNLDVQALFVEAKDLLKYPKIDDKYTGTSIPTLK